MLNNIKDALKSTDFHVEPSMKVLDLSKKFKSKFGLSLRVYKGRQIISDGRVTLNSLDERTTKTSIKFNADKMVIKANMEVGFVEKMFKTQLGIIVQIADAENINLVPNNLTLGNAKRK